jgi:hypothetical protein
MKILMLFIVICIPFCLLSQEDYTLKINNKEYPVSLDTNYRIQVDGKSFTVHLSQNDTLIFKNELFSFNYLKDYKISRLIIEEGIEQFMIMSADGSGIAIQIYSTLDPSMLNEMMLSEVTKESINYGYQMKREDYKKSIKSGQVLDVSRAVLSYKEDTSIYEIATYGVKDEGVLIMTIISNENLSDQGQEIIKLMWSSLSVFL